MLVIADKTQHEVDTLCLAGSIVLCGASSVVSPLFGYFGGLTEDDLFELLTNWEDDL
jgi:hypothetical protein